MLIEIDEGRCIGCGACVADCVGSNLLVEGGLAYVKGRCIMCGHCVAICPTAAVSIPSYDMADVGPSAPASETRDAAVLLRAIKSRRSVRDYRPRPVEPEALATVLEAGRYTATAKNAQGCRFVVVQDALDELKDLVWDGIDGLLALPPADKPRWAKVYKPFSRGRRAAAGGDFLFRNAPAGVFIAAHPPGRPGLGSRGREGPRRVAGGHGTKEAFLLHGRAEGMERMAGKAHMRRIGDAHGRADLGQAFHTADIRFIAGAAPAQLGRIGKPHESGVGQGSDRLPAEKAFLITALGHRPHGPRNDLIKALPERCFHSVHPPRVAQRNPISGGD